MPVVTISRASVGLAALLAASTFGLGAVTSASARTVCGPAGYAAPIATTTSLSLSRTVGEYGSVNNAKVRVSSGVGTPSGNVRISVGGFATYTVKLNGNGVAQQKLPRTLAAGTTYKVTASYAGQGNCQASGPDSKFYTVVRAHTAVRGFEAKDVRSGGRPQVSGSVAARKGTTVRGQVQIRLVHNGKVRQTRTVDLHRGAFGATFKRTTASGGWTAQATFLSNRSFRGSSDTTTFRVGHR